MELLLKTALWEKWDLSTFPFNPNNHDNPGS